MTDRLKNFQCQNGYRLKIWGLKSKYTCTISEPILFYYFSPLVKGEDIFENTDECKTPDWETATDDH